MKRKTTLLALLITALAVFGIPAKKGIWKTITLDNGKKLKAQLIGDEHIHYWKSEQGVAYTASKKNNIYKVADLENMRQKAQTKYLLTSEKHKTMRTRANNASRFTGKKKGLIILVNFADKSFDENHNIELYKRIANEKDFNHEYGFKGSVYDYFYAQSKGLFELTFDVLGPVTLQKGYAYYGGNDDQYAHEMIVEACNAVAEDVDFSDYDWNGDGEVDQVFVLYAGHGEASYDDEDTVWPHEWELKAAMKQPLTIGNMRINTYACSSELSTNSIDGIGTICHEFSHCLGYPDLYDTAYESNFGMGSWDLMSTGAYNGNSFTPAGYTSWEKWMAGWLTPIELTENTEVSGLKPLSEGGGAYIIYNKGNRNEYYLLENRRQTNWDADIPGNGLLVLHVDYDEALFDANIVNTMSYSKYYPNNHQRLTLIHADNDDDSEYWDYRYQSYTKTTEATDAFPYKTNNSLTNYTTPAATVYNSNSDGSKFMNIAITDITQLSDGTISFNFKPVGNDETESVAFFETFDDCNGTGGNDGIWAGSGIAQSKIYYDNEGWTASDNKVFGASQCAKVGTATISGILTTPSTTISNNAVLTFNTSPWLGDDNVITVSVASGNATLSATDDCKTETNITAEGAAAFTLDYSKWNYCSVNINGTGDIKLRFEAKKRFFIDEVKVINSPSTAIKAIKNTGLKPDNRIYNLNGQYLGSDMSVLPRGIYIIGGKKIVK